MSTPINQTTYHLSDVVDAVLATLVAAAPTLGIAANPGIEDTYDVFYGDQALIPRTPAICVEPAPLKRMFGGASNPPRTQNMFTVTVLVYVQEVTDIQVVAQTRDALLDQVQDVLHADWTLGGLLLYGMCTDIDPGYTIRSNRLLRVGKITYEGMNKSFLIDNASVQ